MSSWQPIRQQEFFSMGLVNFLKSTSKVSNLWDSKAKSREKKLSADYNTHKATVFYCVSLMTQPWRQGCQFWGGKKYPKLIS